MSWKPWTRAAARARALRGHKRNLPEQIPHWKIVKDDLVEVLSGKDKGRQGRIVAVARSLNRVFVGGLNTHTRVLPAIGDFPGARIPSEAPLHISNVAIVDPVDGKPCRIKYQYTEDGEKVRVSKRSGRIVPKPAELTDRKDFKSRSGYPEGDKDTLSDDVLLKTYIPSLSMFHEDIDKTLIQVESNV